jgi:RNA polymerase sigma-70 factor (ECF subfamily)
MDYTATQPLSITTGRQDEADLILAARTDVEAFTQLYRRYVTPVYRYCYSRMGNAADAEDVTAQVFIAMWEGLPRYRHRGVFAAWLFTIARRRISDFYRRRRDYLPLDEARDAPVEEDMLSAHLAHTESLRQLATLVAKLDDRQQELLRLRFAAGLNYREIAVVVRRSEGSVKMALHRLLKMLKSNLENEVEVEDEV